MSFFQITEDLRRRYGLPQSGPHDIRRGPLATAATAATAHDLPEPSSRRSVATVAGGDAAGLQEALRWVAEYEERAAIREHSGGYPKHVAEALAFEDVCRRWLAAQSLDQSRKNAGCVHCGGDNPDTPLLARAGSAWVHTGCYTALMERQHQRAMATLAGMIEVAAMQDGRK